MFVIISKPQHMAGVENESSPNQSHILVVSFLMIPKYFVHKTCKFNNLKNIFVVNFFIS